MSVFFLPPKISYSLNNFKRGNVTILVRFILNFLLFTLALIDLSLMLSCQKLSVKRTNNDRKVMTSKMNHLMLIFTFHS